MFRKFNRGLTVMALAALALLTGCETTSTTQPGAVGVNREQRMAISQQEFEQGAAQAYAQMMAEAQKKGMLNRDGAQVERVRRIASRLIPATATFRPDATKWKWEVNVLNTEDVNAWCMPGGKMAVYAGLIQKLNITDDELAAVMGHEMAHALREHSREQASRQAIQGIGIGVVGSLFGLSDTVQQIGQMAAEYTINRRHSREDETEADRIGVELAARSGFDPRAAVSLWNKMAKAGGGEPPQWLSTHPSHETRTRDLTEYSQKVMPLYQAAARR
jgi:predicted Zn-dependent protease